MKPFATKKSKPGRKKGSFGNLKGVETRPWDERLEELESRGIENAAARRFVAALRNMEAIGLRRNRIDEDLFRIGEILRESADLLENFRAVWGEKIKSRKSEKGRLAAKSACRDFLAKHSAILANIKRKHSDCSLRSSVAKAEEAVTWRDISAGHSAILESPRRFGSALTKHSGEKSNAVWAAGLMRAFFDEHIRPLKKELFCAHARWMNAARASQYEKMVAADADSEALELKIAALKEMPSLANSPHAPMFWKCKLKIPADSFSDIARLAGLDCLIAGLAARQPRGG